MSLLQKILDDTEKMIHKVSVNLRNIDEPVKSVIFSDSILLITKDNTVNSLNLILFSCQLFMSKALKEKIPMKGAISYGTLTADFKKSLFFGNPLIDAFTLQDDLFIYGIILDEKVEKKLIRQPKFIKAYCSHVSTPTKSGSIKHFTVNWMLWAGLSFENKTTDYDKATQIMEAFYTDMCGYPRKYIDNTIDYIAKTVDLVK